MCIWQWFPPAPLGANGEETLQTFITEQHAELTTLMAAPVSATSLCSSPLVETYCKMAPNSHSIQTVPNIQVCSVVNLNIWGKQPNLSERSAHLLSKWKSSSPFSVRDLRSGRKFSVYSAKSCHCIMEVFIWGLSVIKANIKQHSQPHLTSVMLRISKRNSQCSTRKNKCWEEHFMQQELISP